MSLFKNTIFQFLPNFTASSVLTAPLQLIANGLVTTANAVNTVLDIVSPIGLAGNQLLGKPFEAIHEAGDKIISNITGAIASTGAALGATVQATDTHHKNEWVDNELNIGNLLNVPGQVFANALVGGTNLANGFLDSVAPLGVLGNNLLGSGFESVHKAGDILIDQISNVITQAGQSLGSNIQGSNTHFENEWKNFDKSRTLYFEKNGQKSYQLTQATVDKIAEMAQKFAQAPKQNVNNLWRPIYTEIKKELESYEGIDKGTLNWFKVAESVATADPKNILYQYVRLGTEKALKAKGIAFTDADFYKASNVLIKTLTDNLLNGIVDENNNVIVPPGFVPTASGAYGLVHMDATQALQNLGGTLADWTGITPFGILDHYLGVDTSILNGGASRPISWYLELLGDVIKATLKGGASLTSIVNQFADAILSYGDLLFAGEVLQSGFSSKDQLVNTLTQVAYAYAGDLAGTVAVATNLFNSKTNIVSTINPFGATLTGKDGNDIINGNVGNDKLYGGKGDDLLFGGWGNDVLDGGTGINVLVGGRGDDTYHVNSNLDFVLEHANEGTDTVISKAEHFQLSQNVENLTLDGNANISGSGNALNNIIKGNSGNNKLYGFEGNDTLDANGGLFNLLNGGTGNDTLNGSKGSDTYEFELGFGYDIINEKGGDDKILFGKGIDIDNLLIQNVSTDLVIAVMGTSDRIVIKNWSKGSDYQVESIQFANKARFDLKTFEYQSDYYV